MLPMTLRAARRKSLKTLAYGANTTITLWDVASRDLVATLVDPVGPTARVVDGAVLSMTFAGDSRTLIASTWTDQLRFWDIRQRQLTATVRKAGKSLIDIAARPDGKVLATTSENEVKVWRAGTRTESENLTFTQEPFNALVLSPDGKSLARGEKGGAVQVWSTTTWNPVQVLDKSIEETAQAMDRAGLCPAPLRGHLQATSPLRMQGYRGPVVAKVVGQALQNALMKIFLGRVILRHFDMSAVVRAVAVRYEGPRTDPPEARGSCRTVERTCWKGYRS
ncbi:hypothetical protein FCH28_13615 [Streptomyces piniterrae]|uniref:Uncharacterized protein n=1 Tax=Streptomyces piniterrae TaxID=2571125 RepID=A0A4U0NVE4_9ACTN|nr:hypothetical protein [Streptomyces piniterrae]TJZ54214.1 hypothetical protein FCH28_13615 [Streptomyces piniterrae]